MATRDSRLKDNGNLGDGKAKLNLSMNTPNKTFDPNEILYKNIMDLDDEMAKKLRIKHNLSGVIIIAFEDLEKNPDQIRLLNSCKFKVSSGKIGRFMHNIIRKKSELM